MSLTIGEFAHKIVTLRRQTITNDYIDKRLMKKLLPPLILLLIFINAVIPVYAINSNNVTSLQLPDIGSETAVLIDADTGQVLYQKDKDKQMYPASITKIMTGMLALEYGELSDTITMSYDAVFSVERDSANIALDVGEQITLEQALYALAVASANDAANGIAEFIGGTTDGFAEMMNTAALELGAVNTHFVNANGLPDDNHYTTAYDMALITAQALKMSGFAEIFCTKRYEISPTNEQPETRIMNSSNRFVNGSLSYDGILMSKAGWTVAAQHTLVTAAERNGTTLIAVVMKAEDSTVKWTDTVALLDYGFEQFSSITIPKNDIVQAVSDDLIQEAGKFEIVLDTYETQDVSLLLPNGYAAEDIQLSVGEPEIDTSEQQVEIPVSLKLTTPNAPYLPEDIMETIVQASIVPVTADTNEADEGAQEGTKTSILKIVLYSVLAIIGFLLLAFVFLVIRRTIILRRRKRRKARERQRIRY